MSALNVYELTVQDLLDDVKNHKSYRPEINSEAEAIMALKGLPPYTYMIRKGKIQYSFYVSFVTEEHTILSEEFRIVEDKRAYQYLNYQNKATTEYEIEIMKKEDPYFLKFLSDLDDIIFLAAMKCSKDQAQTLV